MKRFTMMVVALATLLASTASAQLSSLPRSRANTGANDSALVGTTDSASRSRAVSLRDLFKRVSGTVTRPAYSFVFDSTMGFYRFAASNLGVATAGTLAQRWNEAQQSLFASGSAARPSLSFAADSTTGMYRVNVDTLGFSVKGIRQLWMRSSDTLAQFTATVRAGNGAANKPSLSFSGNSGAGLYRFGIDTIGMATGGALAFRFSGGAAPTIAGGTGSMKIQAGTGASRTLTLQTTNGTPDILNTLVLGADTSVTAIGRYLGPNATATLPAYSFTNSTGTGLYRFGADTLGITTGGAHSLRISGGAAPTISGGAGNMTILAGTGNNRDLILQASNGSGVATTLLTLAGGTSTATFATTVLAGAGSSSTASYGVQSGNATGIYKFGTDTLGIATGGSGGLYICCAGASATKINSTTTTFTIGNTRGTGGSVNIATSTSAGTAKTSLALGTDSSLTTIGQIRAATMSAALPSYTFSGSQTTGIYRVGVDTMGFTAGGRLAVAVRDSQVIAVNGRVAQPAYSFQGDNNTGVYRFGADTIAWAAGGACALRGAVVSSISRIEGCTGTQGLDIKGGSGNSQQVTMYATNNVGGESFVASFRADANGPFFTSNGPIRSDNGTTTFPGISFVNSTNSGWRLGNNSSTDTLITLVNGTHTSFNNGTRDSIIVRTVFTSDTVRATSKFRLTGLTAASGTPNTVCMNSATKEVTENAATSCVVSAARFKTDITPLTTAFATKSLMALTPSSWTYIDGGRKAMGLIADNVDSVDTRLGFRNADGQINSYDQAGIIGLLTKVVQQQQKDIADLKAQVAALTKKDH